MGKFFSRKYTVADDAAPLTSDPLIFRDVDLQIQTNDVKYGDINACEFTLSADDILSYRDSVGVDLREIFFKNAVGAAVGYVVVAGILID
jgi:hypothetical protein